MFEFAHVLNTFQERHIYMHWCTSVGTGYPQQQECLWKWSKNFQANMFNQCETIFCVLFWAALADSQYNSHYDCMLNLSMYFHFYSQHHCRGSNSQAKIFAIWKKSAPFKNAPSCILAFYKSQNFRTGAKNRPVSDFGRLFSKLYFHRFNVF